MEQGSLSEIRSKMSSALTLIKEAVDISLPLLNNNQRERTIALWEDFLREFITYIKSKSRQTGRNLFSYLSFRRIWTR